jgi:hypothetical protein
MKHPLIVATAILAGCHADAPKQKTKLPPAWQRTYDEAVAAQAERNAWNSKTLNLAIGMTQQQVSDVLGSPTRTAVETFRVPYELAWTGLVWHYPCGRVVFQEERAEWFVNSWK